MKLRVSAKDPSKVSADVLVLPFVPRGRRPKLPLAHLLPEDAAKWANPTTDAMTWLQTRGAKAPRAVLASLGERFAPEDLAGGVCGSPDGEFMQAEARRARLGLGACIERAAVTAGVRKLAVYVGEDLELAADIAEGVRMRAYAYEEFKESAAPSLRELQILVDASVQTQARARVEAAWAIAGATVDARRLCDLPPNIGSPEGFVERVLALAEGTELDVEVYDGEEICELGMGMFAAVARGSRNPPRLLCLEHNAERAEELPTVVWIGKGVTMDAGGYDLKSQGIHEMNYDKAGAAAVAGAVLGAARLGLEVHIVAMCGLSENLVGRDALLPGEVLEAFDGTTVYIENTDAEGRLLLADLLAWSESLEAELTVDLATLTGAAHTALGEAYGALFSNDDHARDLLFEAGRRSDDRLWPMPIHDLHDRELAHPHADLKNVGAFAGGASAAAAFLRYFVRGAWAHIDMAGKAHFPYARDYTGPGATGYGCRLLIEVAREVARRGGLSPNESAES